MAVVRKIPCMVRAVTDHGERVYTVELEPSTAVPRFKPGQFLHLALDAYEPGGFWPESRVFSIASSPAHRDRLAITYAVKGAFTTRMERELAPGGRVWVKLPYGEFVVDAGHRRRPVRRRHRDHRLHGVPAVAGGRSARARAALLRRPDAGPVRLRSARPGLCPGGAVADLQPGLRGDARPPAGGRRVAGDRNAGRPRLLPERPARDARCAHGQLRARGVSPADIRTDAWE